MARDDVEAAVIALTRPALASAGYALVDLEFVLADGAWVLRFFIDMTEREGITISDCAAASRLLDPLLDAADCVGDAYTLEVSSPGVNRRVRWPEDFDRFAGETVHVDLATPLEGRRKLRGTLRGMAADEVLVEEAAGKLWHVPTTVIRRATLRRP